MALLKDYFTARAIGIAWDNYQASLGEPPYLGRTKFGTRKQDGLDLAFIKGKNSLPVTLKASAFDAQAELRDAIGFSSIQNEMPFFRESYMVTEKEEQDYATFASSNADRGNQILQNIMKKPLDLIRGARVVPERMVWQLLAPADGVPKINIVIGDTQYTIGYIPSSEESAYKETNFKELKGDAQWSQSATATPLDDLITIKREFAKATGYSLARFSMNTETWEQLLACEDTKKQVMGIIAYEGGIRLRQEDVVAYLAQYGISIEVYDKIYVDETGTSQYFIPTGFVSAQSAGVYLGDVVYGTTPEERSGDLAQGSLAIVDSGVSVYTYTTDHPLNTHCVCSEIVLPTYEGMDSVVTINVDAGSTSA